MSVQVSASRQQYSLQICDEFIVSLNNNKNFSNDILEHIEFLSNEKIFELLSNRNISIFNKNKILQHCTYKQLSKLFEMFSGNEEMTSLMYKTLLSQYKNNMWILKEHLKEEIMKSGSLRLELNKIKKNQSV